MFVATVKLYLILSYLISSHLIWCDEIWSDLILSYCSYSTKQMPCKLSDDNSPYEILCGDRRVPIAIFDRNTLHALVLP